MITALAYMTASVFCVGWATFALFNGEVERCLLWLVLYFLTAERGRQERTAARGEGA